MGIKHQVEDRAREAWDRITGDGSAGAPEPADGTADTFELCINADQPGGGTVYQTIEEAKAAGYAVIAPVKADGAPRPLDGDAYFTVHRIDASGRGSALAFNSNQAEATA